MFVKRLRMFVKERADIVINADRLRPELKPASRVVIADADDDTRSLYREALRQLGVDVIATSDGRDALVQCLIQPTALVITDTWLPFVDGYELCRLLRRDAMTRTVPIIVVTADIRTAELVPLRRLGAISIVSKPVSVDALVAEVGRLCDESTAAEPTVEHHLEISSPRLRHAIGTRSFRRFETTTPPTLPPPLRCPVCDRPLVFRKSRIGGVTRSNAEQWDAFYCPECNDEFEYRHRTKKLRSIR
jgi:CheY-like chemotaxis protein